MQMADGGGGYGGTNWMSKDVRFMWSTIANQETDPHFDVVGGWRKTADLTLAHLGQVQQYRESLASVWPPTKSAAAAAYLARLDKLITDLQATHDAASANYTAFSTVTLTLSMARTKLKPILEQYEANEQLNLDWQAKQDAAEARSDISTLTPTFKIPPVSATQQENLNTQARAIMYDLSSTIISGQAALKKPAPYDPNPVSREDSKTNGSDIGSGPGFAAAPVIPSPGASSGGSSGSTYIPASHSIVTPINPTTNVPTQPGEIGGGPATGPVLGGLGPNPITTPAAPGPLPPPGPSSMHPLAPPGLIPGIIAPPQGARLTPLGLPPNSTQAPPQMPSKSGVGMGSAGRMTMPSGGVIGATPGSGMIGQMPAGNPSSRQGGPARANPVGGVIGQQGGRPPSRRVVTTGRGGPNQNPPSGNQAGRQASQRESTKPSRWDPDNPWATDEGVAPVVVPPDDQGPIDPGPAIGYSR